jgi:hypothetical protein
LSAVVLVPIRRRTAIAQGLVPLKRARAFYTNSSVQTPYCKNDPFIASE